MLASNFERIAVEELHIFFNGSGEGVVGGNVPILLFVPEHERELYHPQEVKLVCGNFNLAALLQKFAGLQAYAAQDRAGLLPLRSGKEHYVAVFNI